MVDVSPTGEQQRRLEPFGTTLLHTLCEPLSVPEVGALVRENLGPQEVVEHEDASETLGCAPTRPQRPVPLKVQLHSGRLGVLSGWAL